MLRRVVHYQNARPADAAARLDPLRPLADGIWVAERPQTFYGLPVGTRMTVIRLRGERLLLHSPVALDSELRAELDSIGRVSYAVAPNRVHHLYAGEVAKVYPEARFWVAPGLDVEPGFLHRHYVLLFRFAPS